MFFEKESPLSLAPGQIQSEPDATWKEVIGAAYDKSFGVDRSTSDTDLLRNEWQPIIEEVNERTGSDFYNPANHFAGTFRPLAPSSEEGHDMMMYKWQKDKVLKHIKENADKLPDLQSITHEDLVFQAQEQAKYNYNAFNEVMGRATDAKNLFGSLIGGIGAMGTDPVVVSSMVLPLNRASTLRGTMFREALIGAGSEAIIQPSVAKWYKTLGLKYTWEQFATAVAAGGIFGAGFPLALSIGGQTVRLTTDQVKKGYDALIKSGATKETSNLKTAREAAEEADEIEADNPISSSEEHIARLEQAELALNSSDVPRISETPEAPRKPIKDVYETDNLNGVFRQFKPEEINVDAKLFQFKEGGDEFGVTDRLQGVTQWDPIKSGTITVYEFADGRKFIADGHQRLGLAKRIATADPTQDVRLIGYTLRETDGITPEMARVIAAVKNIAEGTGTAIDAAKVLRDAPERIGELPPRSALVRQAQGLTLLSDNAFGMVINGVVPANYAALVGRLIPDNEGLQDNALSVLAKTDPANEFQAESIIRQVREAGAEEVKQVGLFGEEVITQSFFAERARILDRAQKALRQDKNAFNSLVRNAEQLESEGNQLAKEANARRAQNDAEAITILQALANRKGPLSDALTAAAKQARETGSYTQPTRGFLDAVRRSIDAGDFNRATTSNDGRSFDVAAKSREDATEPEPEFADFSEPGGIGAQRQADQLEIDELPPRREAMQEDERLRDDLRQLLERKADETEVDNHPAVIKALQQAESITPTHTADNFLSETYITQREFNFNGETVVGFDNALLRLYESAKTLAYETGTPAPTRFEKKATIVVGPPAAGKSSIANPIARKMGAVIIDADEAKKVLPEYQNGIGAMAVHEESAAIAELLEKIALTDGANIVLPKVGADSKSIRSIIQRYKSQGYDVDLVDMSVKYAEARRRMYLRFVDTGRLVDPQYVKAVGDNPGKTYDILKKEGAADGYARIDNNGPRDAEKPILEDTRNLLEGTELRLSEGRGERSEMGARGTSPESGPERIIETESELELDLKIPIIERVNDEGEVVAQTMTLRQIRNELDQDQIALDRLKGCVV